METGRTKMNRRLTLTTIFLLILGVLVLQFEIEVVQEQIRKLSEKIETLQKSR